MNILQKIATGNVPFPTKENDVLRFPGATRAIRKAADKAQKILEPKRTPLTDEEREALFKSNFPK